MVKYNVIVADPPFSFRDRLTMDGVKRGAASQYSLLRNEDIVTLPVKNIVADDAVLICWVPSSLLQIGLDIMKSWGFKQTQTIVWNKIKKTIDRNVCDLDNCLTFGMGRLFRQAHEICIVGVRGKIYKHLTNRSKRSVHFAQNLKHSKKPEILQDMLDCMFTGKEIKKLEIFARRSRPGWDCVGNQCPDSLGEDIRDSLVRIAML